MKETLLLGTLVQSILGAGNASWHSLLLAWRARQVCWPKLPWIPAVGLRWHRVGM